MLLCFQILQEWKEMSKLKICITFFNGVEFKLHAIFMQYSSWHGKDPIKGTLRGASFRLLLLPSSGLLTIFKTVQSIRKSLLEPGVQLGWKATMALPHYKIGRLFDKSICHPALASSKSWKSATATKHKKNTQVHQSSSHCVLATRSKANCCWVQPFIWTSGEHFWLGKSTGWILFRSFIGTSLHAGRA